MEKYNTDVAACLPIPEADWCLPEDRRFLADLFAKAILISDPARKYLKSYTDQQEAQKQKGYEPVNEDYGSGRCF